MRVSNCVAPHCKVSYRHGLEHLSRDDNGLASDVALGNHHLLGEEHLAGRNLNTQITTGDHDTIRLLQDGVEVGDTLLVLDLGDDLDVGTVRAEDLADVADILSAADEGGEDHVDAVLDTELEVLLVLLGQSGKVDSGLREVDTLVGGEHTIVDGADAHIRALDAEDEEGEDTVIDVDELARSGDLGQIFLMTKSGRSRRHAGA